MYVSGFSCTPVLSKQYLCKQRGPGWVQMCPVVGTQWTTLFKELTLETRVSTIGPGSLCFYKYLGDRFVKVKYILKP